MEFEPLTEWLQTEARRLIDGCRRPASDGITQCFTPDRTGQYGAMWTRDLCYMVEGCPEAFSDEDLRRSVEYLLNGVREDGVAPDRVQMNGLAVYSAGPVANPAGLPPTDNAQFLVKLVELTVNRTGDPEFLTKHRKTLDNALQSIPRREDGLVFIDPDGPKRSPYGFTDCVHKTGAVLFSSILYQESLESIARLCDKAGQGTDAAGYRAEADRVRQALSTLWDQSEGIFLAAIQDCRQPDVWGSAYAVHTGAATDRQARAVSCWLDEHYDEIVWEGMVRHIREPGGWQSLLVDMPVDIFQNGGYWPTPSAWVADSLRITNPAKADRMLLDLLGHMREHGANEWENRDGAVGVREYVASATLPLIALRGGTKPGDP